MPRLRLQHKQWVAGAMIVACCLVLGGTYFSQSLDAYNRANDSLREFKRFNAVLAALNAMSLERRPGHLAMIGPVDDADKLSALRIARQDTDRLVEKAESALTGSRDEAELLWSFVEGRSRLVRARRLMDEVLQVAASDRSDEAITRAVDAMFMAYESTEVARDRLGQIIVSLEPELGSEVYLAIAASALRDQAGRLIAFTLEGLRPISRPSTTRDRRVYSSAGRLWAIRDNIRNFSVVAKFDPNVASLLWSVDNEFYSRTIPKTLLIYTEARTENRMQPSAFGEAIGGDLMRIQHLRETLEAWSYSRAGALRDKALYGVLLSASLSSIATLIVIMMSIALRRLLFAPLMLARKQIVAMTNGDLSDQVSSRLHSPEMEEMFQGLASLRDEQRFRRQLEADQLRMADQLKRLSETDMLTGLLNRRALEETALAKLRKAKENGGDVGLILFDIDHFKSINDSFGHAAGDAVLQAVASGLRSCLPRDAAFARFGGEEFVVLLWGELAKSAEGVAHRLRLALRQMDFTATAGQTVTASFGTVVRDGGSSLDLGGMLKVADRRLYAAKRAGRDQVCGEDPLFDSYRGATSSSALGSIGV